MAAKQVVLKAIEEKPVEEKPVAEPTSVVEDTQTHTDTQTEVETPQHVEDDLEPSFDMNKHIEALRGMSIFERIDAAFKEIVEYDFRRDKAIEVRSGKARKYLSIIQILSVVRRVHGHWGVKVFFDPPVYDEDAGEFKKVEYINGQNQYHAFGHIPYRIYGRDASDCIAGNVSFESATSSDKMNNLIVTNAERTLYRVLYAIDGDEKEFPDDESVVCDVQMQIKPPMSRAEKAKQLEGDRLFGSNKEKPKAQEKVKPVIDDHLPNAKELSEATYGPSTVSDSTYTKARMYARKWITEHEIDEEIQNLINRFHTTQLDSWPRSYVVDVANLYLESKGEALLTYDLPKEARE